MPLRNGRKIGNRSNRIICYIYTVRLTCFNNIFSNNELISNRFAVFVTCTHILTCETGYWSIFIYVYMTVCKVPRVLFNIWVCERKLIFLGRVLSLIFNWFGMVRRIPSLYDWCSVFVKRGMLLTVHVQVDLAKRRRERTGSYLDGHGNGRSVQLVHFMVI